MKRFTVPCLFPGKQTSDFYFFVGNPNKDYAPLQFQAQWLLKSRKGIVDKKFLRWLEETRETALNRKMDFETLCSQVHKWGNSFASDSKESAKSEHKAIELTEPQKEEVPSTSSPSQTPLHKANLLLPLWSGGLQGDNDHSAKQRVIADVVGIILDATDKKPSKGGRYLLPFLLSYERKSLIGILQGIESQEVRNLTYPLVLIADTEGKSISWRS